MTSLAEERAEQKRWRLLPRYARLDWFDALVEREFLAADEQRARQAGQLAKVVRFCANHVSYYRDLFQSRGISPEDIRTPEDLPRLPLLSRFDVQDRSRDLMPQRLPKGQRLGNWTKTSGTTGQPVRVLHTAVSQAMFPMTKQREMRWFRFDPKGTLAAIRAFTDLPRFRDKRKVPEGYTWKIARWPSVGQCFETGPFLGFASSNPLEAQIEWLDQRRPDYLMAQAAQLEHLALAFQGRELPGLKAIEAISQQLTPEMRRRIESIFRVPVHENYGLNEFGIIATRCPEGGRYHIHAEFCLVEIVDAEGKPCAPGQTGRILVTSLVNAAMPLLRYDADDMAEVLTGPCPCGRTLPAFGAITGRYRRLTALPPGIWEYWRQLLRALDAMPDELQRPLRQYQLHHYRDGRFELRLAVKSALDPAFLERLRAGWQIAAKDGEPLAELAIVELDSIPVKPGAKFQNFTSDLMPSPEPGADSATSGES